MSLFLVLVAIFTNLLLWYRFHAAAVSDREVTLAFACLIGAFLAHISLLSSSKEIIAYLSRHATAANDKAIADLVHAHAQHVALIKHQYQSQNNALMSELHNVEANRNRAVSEHDYMSALYEDNVRTVQELEDRVAYLTTKLQEYGHSTPGMSVSYSAPTTAVNVASSPLRTLFEGKFKLKPAPSPLKKVFEEPEKEATAVNVDLS